MKRADPVDLRKALDFSNVLAKQGILFVPMPVADMAEHNSRLVEAMARLDEMAAAAEAEGGVS